jgi:hypothetical protein
MARRRNLSSLPRFPSVAGFGAIARNCLRLVVRWHDVPTRKTCVASATVGHIARHDGATAHDDSRRRHLGDAIADGRRPSVPGQHRPADCQYRQRVADQQAKLPELSAKGSPPEDA